MTAHQARKRFGQNFLVDLAVVDSIVRAIAPKRDDVMIEIGPGLSALTAPLLDQLEKLTAIEIDRDLAARLRQRFAIERLTVVEADPVVKGQTAASSYKPGLLENGLKVLIPPFIEAGTKIVVATEDCSYVERAK